MINMKSFDIVVYYMYNIFHVRILCYIVLVNNFLKKYADI